MGTAKLKLENANLVQDIDDDFDMDYDTKAKSQKEGILERLLRTETSYQQSSRRLLKASIESHRAAHRSGHESITSYVDLMERFDAVFADIRRKEGVEDIADILATIDVYEQKYREKSKDLGFVENRIIELQKEIIDGKEELFSCLNSASERIEGETVNHIDSRVHEIIQSRTHE